MELSKEQDSAKDIVLDWFYGSNKPIFIMGGYAGTGKTTLLGYIRNQLPPDIKVAFCCYTAKAASVLKFKLLEIFALKPADFCGTIHSLIYKPIIDEETDKIIGWERKESLDFMYDLIVVDEASMVSESIYDDLSSYQVPILAVGDCFQLPPIEGKLNIMDKPDVKLNTIHRQAKGNPIIELSLDVRKCGYIQCGSYGGKVAKVNSKNHEFVRSFIANTKSFLNTMILCGFNDTRVKINDKMRQNFGYSGRPSVGERVVCLKNNYNSKDCLIMNGSMGIIDGVADSNSHWEMKIKMDNEEREFYGPVDKLTFGNPTPDFTSRQIQRLKLIPHMSVPEIEVSTMDFFDYGYCMSVHKSQGSQCQRVMVIEERASMWDDTYTARWLYTAITRASEQLLIVQNYR